MFRLIERIWSKFNRAGVLLLQRIELACSGRRCKVFGFDMVLPRNVLSTHCAHMLLRGGSDGEDIRLLAKYVHPGDFVLNLGSGTGFTAMAAMRQVSPGGKVTAVEADPQIEALSHRNLELNGMQHIRVINGAAVADRETKQVTFYRKRNYYGSGLLNNGGVGQPITVPGVYPPDLIDRTVPGRTILLCDIEGYETSLLANREVLDCFDLVITELHFGIDPKDKVSPLANMFEQLNERGFKIIDVDDTGFVFERHKPA